MQILQQITNKNISERVSKIDFWKGIAVIIMIIANTSAYTNTNPEKILFRIFLSCAAPIFIFLSGYTFEISSLNKFVFNKKILNGALIIITAALIDIFIWGIYPFVTFDVLYLIGIGILINTILFKKNEGTLGSLTVVCYIIIKYNLQYKTGIITLLQRF